MSDVMGLSVIVILLVFAGFTALSETAISRMSRVRAHHLAQERKTRAAQALERITDDPAPFLTVVLLLTLVAHTTATAIATGLAIRHFHKAGEAVAAGLMTFVIFVFAEAVPKTFTVQRTDRAALFMARPVLFFGRILKPLSRLLILVANGAMVLLPGHGLPQGPFVTEDEIRHTVDVAEEEGSIEEDEKELIHSIFEFGDTVVREVMVPRPDMVTLPSNVTLNEALDMIIEAGYSRVPLYEGDSDNIVGILYAKDLLKSIHQQTNRPANVAVLGRTATFVPEQKKVADLLREMQQERVHMVIVVDEYGGTAGLCTIEDVIEEIVGEIVDEYDKEEPLVEPIDEVSIRVDGKMSIDDVNELLGAQLPDDEWDTVGGLVFGLIGRVPMPGETVRFDSMEFRTERVTGRRIQKVVITQLPPETEPQPVG
ncbi:MAG: hemolysin family protein [Actinomycetota bacterium]|nr:hemolysin family protein [Actinomycetota bacterium]